MAPPDEDPPIITFIAGRRTFERIFNETSLNELAGVVRAKLGLPEDEAIKLSQVRGERHVDLEDESDFSVFRMKIFKTRVAEVEVTVLNDKRPAKRRRVVNEKQDERSAVHSVPEPDATHAAAPPTTKDASVSIKSNLKRKISVGSSPVRNVDPSNSTSTQTPATKRRKINHPDTSDDQGGEAKPSVHFEEVPEPVVSTSIDAPKPKPKARKKRKSDARTPTQGTDTSAGLVESTGEFDDIFAILDTKLANPGGSTLKVDKKKRKRHDSLSATSTDAGTSSEVEEISRPNVQRAKHARRNSDTAASGVASSSSAQDQVPAPSDPPVASKGKGKATKHRPEQALPESAQATALTEPVEPPATSTRKKRGRPPKNSAAQLQPPQVASLPIEDTAPAPQRDSPANGQEAQPPAHSQVTPAASPQQMATVLASPLLNSVAKASASGEFDQPVVVPPPIKSNSTTSAPIAPSPSSNSIPGADSGQIEATVSQLTSSAETFSSHALIDPRLVTPPREVEESSQLHDLPNEMTTILGEDAHAKDYFQQSSSPLAPAAILVAAESVAAPPNRSVIKDRKCPLCGTAPFHMRYACPIVIAGVQSIADRIHHVKQLMQTADDASQASYHSQLRELDKWLTKAQEDDAKCEFASNLPQLPAATPAVKSKGLDVRSSASNRQSIGHGNAPVKPVDGESSSESDSETETDSEDEAATTKRSASVKSHFSSKKPAVGVATGMDWSTFDLEELMRGPGKSSHRMSIDELIPDAPDADDTVEPADVAILSSDEDDEEVADRKYRKAERLASAAAARRGIRRVDSDEESESDIEAADDPAPDVRAVSSSSESFHLPSISKPGKSLETRGGEVVQVLVNPQIHNSPGVLLRPRVEQGVPPFETDGEVQQLSVSPKSSTTKVSNESLTMSAAHLLTPPPRPEPKLQDDGTAGSPIESFSKRTPTSRLQMFVELPAPATPSRLKTYAKKNRTPGKQPAKETSSSSDGELDAPTTRARRSGPTPSAPVPATKGKDAKPPAALTPSPQPVQAEPNVKRGRGRPRTTSVAAVEGPSKLALTVQWAKTQTPADPILPMRGRGRTRASSVPAAEEPSRLATAVKSTQASKTPSPGLSKRRASSAAPETGGSRLRGAVTASKAEKDLLKVQRAEERRLKKEAEERAKAERKAKREQKKQDKEAEKQRKVEAKAQRHAEKSAEQSAKVARKTTAAKENARTVTVASAPAVAMQAGTSATQPTAATKDTKDTAEDVVAAVPSTRANSSQNSRPSRLSLPSVTALSPSNSPTIAGASVTESMIDQLDASSPEPTDPSKLQPSPVTSSIDEAGEVEDSLRLLDDDLLTPVNRQLKPLAQSSPHRARTPLVPGPMFASQLSASHPSRPSLASGTRGFSSLRDLQLLPARPAAPPQRPKQKQSASQYDGLLAQNDDSSDSESDSSSDDADKGRATKRTAVSVNVSTTPHAKVPPKFRRAGASLSGRARPSVPGR